MSKGDPDPGGKYSWRQPRTTFREKGSLPFSPSLCQRVGMIVGVNGVGHAVAALDPLRRWRVVLAGLLGNVLGPIRFLSAVVWDTLSLSSGLTSLTNRMIWWVPFTLILLRAYRTSKTRQGTNA